MITLPPPLMKYLLTQISSQMRSPSNTLQGQLAMYIMKTFNRASIRHAVQRLELKHSDSLVEIGAGHGEVLRALVDLNRGRMEEVEEVEKVEETEKNWNATISSSSSSSSSSSNDVIDSSLCLPKRIVLVEISPEFQKELHDLIQNEILPTNLFSFSTSFSNASSSIMPSPPPSTSSTTSSTSSTTSSSPPLSSIEIHTTDCLTMPYLPPNSITTIFGFNSIYFLHPLSTYLHEMKRVLQPRGRVVFGCKFASLPEKGSTEEFVNVDRREICKVMEEVGFEGVRAEKVLVDGGENGMKNYVEISGVKPGVRIG